MRILALLASLSLLAAVLELVRRRRLREEFSLLWVVGAFGALTLSLWDGARSQLASALGTSEESALLATAALFLAMVCLDISTKVSRLANQQKHLVQEFARLEKRVSDIERDNGRG
jgi:hypothetical protein